MVLPVIIAGFTLGAAGSLHCVGMCGPLSLALPVHHLSSTKKLFYLLAYQLGRIVTYSLMGLLIGLAGRRIYIAGFQQVFSVTMGLLILCLAAMYFLQRRVIHLKFLTRFYLFVQLQIGTLLKSVSSPAGFFLMGMANGLLPCGMIYIALATTLSFTQLSESILFMAMFGAGTLPAMMLVGYAGQVIKPNWRTYIRKMIPIFISLMGIVLILRGMNLGIPFLSPELSSAPNNTVTCHP